MYLNLPRYSRYLTAALGSFLVTTGLVYLMVQLVTIDDLGLDETPPYLVTEFVRVPEDEPEPVRKEQPVKPPVVEVEPPPPEMLVATNDTDSIGINITAPVSVKPGPGAFARVVDGEQLPIVKVAPQYPRRAAQNGVEGYVILSFTITTTGAIADPVVIESHPSSVFNQSALRAVRKFKYRPKVVNGEAQPVYGVQHRLTYELTNG